MSGIDRRGSKNREFLLNDANPRIIFDECLQPWLDLATIGTAIIKEFYERNIASRIAKDWSVRIFEKVFSESDDL